MPNKDDIKKKFGDLRQTIDAFENNIKEIIEKLNKVAQKMELYYNIKNNIFKNLNNENRNYESLSNLINISKDDYTIRDMNEIINEVNINKKFNYIIEIYKKIIGKIVNYDQKEQDLNGKIEEISKLITNKSQLGNNSMNISFCNTIHNGIMCKNCLQKPIIGYRYKCSECNDFDLCSKCEEENSLTGKHPHDFIKIRNNKNENHYNNNKNFTKFNDDNENHDIFNINNNNTYNLEENDNVLNEIKDENNENQYSFECLNTAKLTTYLYEGTSECRMQIVLRNNGNSAWPMNNTNLIFDEFSDFKADNVILKPQNPQEQELYEIVFKGLYGYPPDEYKSILKFSVNGQSFGEIKLKFVIKPKKEEIGRVDEIYEYRDKIEEFRELYGLSKEDYSDVKILKELKENNFDYVSTFGKLFN